MNKSLIVEIRSLYANEEYGKAIELLNKNDKSLFNSPQLLVWKSRCLLLSDDEKAENALSEAKICLLEAIKLDETYLAALIDLGYFYLRVEGKYLVAKELFLKASTQIKSDYSEVLQGLVESETEVTSVNDALKLLHEKRNLELDDETIEEFRSELIL